MARKVFISFLGTGFYGKCQYEYRKFCSSNTRFIQHATLEMLEAKKWGKSDVGYILLTDEARSTNWTIENGRRYNWSTKSEEEYIDLDTTLKNMELPFEVKGVSIPKGIDEDEIWRIFDIVYNLLNDSDSLYVDLTHGYRYLPMFMLVMGNYSKFLKKVKVCSLTYGNYEERKDSKAPFVNLMPFSTLQDWTFAAADFKENGYSQRLFQLSKEQLTSAYKNETTPDKEDVFLNDCLASLSKIIYQRLTCRGMDVYKSEDVNNAVHQLDSFETNIKSQFLPLIDEMRDALKDFNIHPDIRNLFSAAKWCFNKHLYQQAVTFLEEGVITFFCSRHGIEFNDKNRRELVTSAFQIKIQNIPREMQRVKDESWRPILEDILKDEFLSNKTFVSSVSDLIDFRNDYNHCGFRKGAQMAKKIKDKTGIFISSITDVICCSCEECLPTLPYIFLNLSNHSSTSWETAQFTAAQEYGTVEDIPFPAIPPEASNEDMEQMTETLVKKILKKAENAVVTVHVMGEMTFTYALVSRLKMEGITCVASTTKRIAEEKDGVKTSEFKFVRFREY